MLSTATFAAYFCCFFTIFEKANGLIDSKALVNAAQSIQDAHNNYFNCPDHETMSDFNIGKFLGEWYEVANYNDDVYDRGGTRCPKYIFKYEDGEIKMTNVRSKTYPRNNMMNHNEVCTFAKTQQGIVEYEKKETLVLDVGKFIIHYKTDTYKDKEIKREIDEQIDVIYTDYKTFAIINNCTPRGILGAKNIGWLLSRTPEVHMTDEEKRKMFKEIDDKLKEKMKKTVDYYNNKYIDEKCFNGDRYKDIKTKRLDKPWEEFKGDLKIVD